MKYKVGDVVKVRSDLSIDKLYNGFSVTADMLKFKGKFVHIVEIFEDSYHIFENNDNRRFFWVDEMFEPFNEEDVKKHFEEYIKGFKDYDIKFELKKKEPILDEKEKKYLSNFIRPFRDRVKYIEKIDCRTDNNTSFINICMLHINKQENEIIYLPFFKTNTMYKGMEKDKKYTLEELGI